MMKGKRFSALFLTAALTMSLAVTASAVTFIDVAADHWAKSDIEIMADKGVVKGVGEGKFAPGRKMTACEALLFCSRTTGVSVADKARIASAYAEKLKTLLPAEMYSWSYEEMAVCLETGIITEEELSALNDAGALVRSISREKMAKYLVRAMQLESAVKELSTYPLSFVDTADIAEELQPYVYMLNMYGIIKGNKQNEFMPDGSLTRAEMTAMLHRMMDFMAERGIYAELPRYTDYEWMGGIVEEATAGENNDLMLTLNSKLSGKCSIAIPEDSKIYQNNMLGTTADIRTGEYIRVNLNRDGKADSVRIGGTLTVYSGTLNELDQQTVSLKQNGTAENWKINRFTKVKAGSVIGGPSVIDPAAGYTSAICYVDEMGGLVALDLSGNGHEEPGILTGLRILPSEMEITLTAPDGSTRCYSADADTDVVVDGKAGTLSDKYMNCKVSIRLSDEEDGGVIAVSVDTSSRCVQGAIYNYTLTRQVNMVSLENLDTGKIDYYDFSEHHRIYCEGKEIPLEQLEKTSFATLTLQNGKIVRLDAYPAETVTKGTVESVKYAFPIVLTVKMADGNLTAFELNPESLPDIRRDGENSGVDRINAGDDVSVTVRYQKLTKIDIVSKTAVVNGTVTRILQDSKGLTVEVRMEDGSRDTYSLSGRTAVKRNGKTLDIYDLRVNDVVKMTITSGEVMSVDVDRAEENVSDSFDATVLTTNTREHSAILLLGDGTAKTVQLSKASFVDAGGNSFSFGSLKSNDQVTVYGEYIGNEFVANLIVRTGKK